MAENNTFSPDRNLPLPAGSNDPAILREKRDWGSDSLLPSLLGKHISGSDALPRKLDFSINC
jgi:hypothetical protein